MTRGLFFLVIIPLMVSTALSSVEGGGITPEQIYQRRLDWNRVVGTWEALPVETPLSENAGKKQRSSHRILMTLRKDGTCRVFNKDHPVGSDGMWVIDGHKMVLTHPNGGLAEFYIYGVKGDFMITRSPIKNGKHQLWSRVK